MKCQICSVDKAIQQHHILPRSLGGKKTVWCCSDCGNQIHMLFNNKELSYMSFEELLMTNKMTKYLKWKRKHSGIHRYKMSNEVKKWKKGHR